jgi:hypothetical protein
MSEVVQEYFSLKNYKAICRVYQKKKINAFLSICGADTPSIKNTQVLCEAEIFLRRPTGRVLGENFTRKFITGFRLG